ncbi:hypothetical protein Tamer19_37830 [Cupriavidus sp. TA19]|nr:hypothetical protein Tamer19_37830 [Cupriavidus sp. TA19]
MRHADIPGEGLSSTALVSVPDCEMKAGLPGFAAAWAKIAFRPMPDAISPAQFGREYARGTVRHAEGDSALFGKTKSIPPGVQQHSMLASKD